MPSREHARVFLAYGFGISIAVHAILLPFVRREETFAEEPPVPPTTIVHVPTPPPTPPPTPRPTPTPAPTAPPPHEPPRPHVPQQRIRIVAPHVSAHGGGAAEHGNEHVAGDAHGVPDTTATGAPVEAKPIDVVGPPPTPAPTPRPTPTPMSCARPDVPAATVRAVEPETPALAQQQGIAGTVNVVVSLDASSRVVATRIQSSPSAVLNGAALAAARGSQFRTEVKDCRPVAADYIFSVDFTAQ